MADPTLTNSASGTDNVAAVTASFGFTATAGRLLVLTVGSDDYNSGNPTGYTLSTGMEQETFLGSYVWWKIASGSETSVTYNILSAANSCWTVTEYDNVDPTPYDVSDGQLTTGSITSYTTPAIAPSSGRRLLLAVIGGADNTNFSGLSTWTNSFVEQKESFTNVSATKDIIGIAMLVVDGDGVTTFSSGATYDHAGVDAGTGQIISFKVASAGPGSGSDLSAIGMSEASTNLIAIGVIEETS